ncbi:MAG: hypothetical protein LBL20_00235, partial [Treponema sp.]|nr:hypothetical protein [Treponema sp.]
MIPLPGRVFQAVRGFEGHLRYELGGPGEVWGDLYYAGNAGGADAGGNAGNAGNAGDADAGGWKPV